MKLQYFQLNQKNGSDSAFAAEPFGVKEKHPPELGPTRRQGPWRNMHSRDGKHPLLIRLPAPEHQAPHVAASVFRAGRPTKPHPRKRDSGALSEGAGVTHRLCHFLMPSVTSSCALGRPPFKRQSRRACPSHWSGSSQKAGDRVPWTQHWWTS